MRVQCPNCGHSGTLPPGIASAPHKIHCRRCGVRFDSKPPEVNPTGLSDLATQLGIQPETQSEEDEAIKIPDDGAGGLNIDVSDDEPLAESEPPITIPPDPWFHGLLRAWGALYLVGAGLALLAMVFALVGILNSPSQSISALSYVALLPFVLGAFVSTTCAAVLFLIVDVAQNVPLMRFHAERTESILRTEARNRG